VSKKMWWGGKGWKGKMRKMKKMWKMWKSGKNGTMKKMKNVMKKMWKRSKHGRGGKHQKIYIKNPVVNVYNKFEDLNMGTPAVGKWNTTETPAADPCATLTTEEACDTPEA
jgi:hypothetical protein